MIEIVKSADGYHLRNGGALVFGPATIGACRSEANRRGKRVAPGVVELAPEPTPTPAKKRARKSG